MRRYLLLLKNELLPTPQCQCEAAMCSTHRHDAVLSATLVLVTHTSICSLCYGPFVLPKVLSVASQVKCPAITAGGWQRFEPL